MNFERCFSIIVLLIFITNAFGQLNEISIQKREYVEQGDKWYIKHNGVIGNEIVPNRLMVKVKNKGYLNNNDLEVMNIHGVSFATSRFMDGYYVLAIDSSYDSFGISKLLEKSNLFEDLEFVSYGERCAFPNDPRYDDQWNLPKINIPDAWEFTKGNSSKILAIIDSGVKYNHIDLDGNIWVNPSEDYNQNGKPDFYATALGGDQDGLDNDSNGKIDDLIGWDYIEADNNPTDEYGHGTMVCGIPSAQTDNKELLFYRGIAGVAGGWNSTSGNKVMVLKDGDFYPYSDNTCLAILYAAQNGADVINISTEWVYDPLGMSDAINTAVNTYGAVVIAATGNKGDTSNPGVRYPAKYSNTIAVGSTDANDERHYDSSYGPEIDVVAPSNIPTTNRLGGYSNNARGTSFAAPTVAGLASLIVGLNPSLTTGQIRSIISNSADIVPDMQNNNFTNEYGYGRINVYQALKSTVENYGATLTQDIEVKSGKSLNFTSSTVVNLNSKKITTSGGSITIANGAEINPYFCIKNGSTVKALYPSFAEAFSEVNSGETIEIGDNIILANTITIPDGVTIKLISNASIQLANCYLFFGAGAEITPNISLNSSSTSYVYGYHSALNDALDYCTTGKTVEVSGEYTSTVDINVDEDETLKPQSGSELKFAPEKYLNINSGGNLTASGATFTHTSGFWGGIKYQSGSSGSLYYCDINNASDGVHITNANPTIQNNIIENCEDYGLYVYNASPTINSNSIIDSRVYFNACLSTLNNNYITGATSVENPPICSIYMYNSSQTFWYNTINIEDEFSIVTYNSSLEFGLTGEGPPECGGYNVLDNQSGGDGIIHATNYSDIYLGQGDDQELYDYGYNSIFGESCPLWTDGTSYIDAQWCHWVDEDPAPSCYGNVETDYELDEDPDGGSSLAKSLSSSESLSENSITFEDSLFSNALQMMRDKEYGLALATLEQIIIDYEDSKYAYRAINLSLKLCRNQKIADTEEWLGNIAKSISNDDLSGMIDLKKVSVYQGKGKIDKAIALSEKIPNTRKNKKYEVASLFNLFNFHHKDKENLEMAKLYLEELKAKYPDNDLTYIARMDMNEEITYNKLEKDLSSKALFEEEEINIPETYALKAAFPNPFNPSTTLEYSLPLQSEVECSIYDVSGNLVKEFNFDQNPGTHSIVWNGSKASSGIYLIRFVAEASDRSETFVDYQKVTLLK